MQRHVCASLVLALGVACAHAQSSSTKAAAGAAVGTPELLATTIPELHLIDQPLDAVFAALGRDLPGVNFIVRWAQLEAYGIDRDRTISVDFKNFRLDQALWLVLSEASGGEVRLAYRASGNTIVISTAEALGSEIIIKVYDVTDLLMRVTNFRGAPQIDPAQAAQQAGGAIFTNNGGDFAEGTEPPAAGAVDPDLELLMQTIIDTVEPGSWRQGGGAGAIRAFRRQIVVSNTIAVHQKLGGAIDAATD